MELISREEVLKHLKPLDEEETDGIFVSLAKEILQQAYDVVGKMPIVESRPKGKWVETKTLTGIAYSCSICGTLKVYKHNYCEQCGAEMENE